MEPRHFLLAQNDWQPFGTFGIDQINLTVRSAKHLDEKEPECGDPAEGLPVLGPVWIAEIPVLTPLLHAALPAFLTLILLSDNPLTHFKDRQDRLSTRLIKSMC